MNGPHLWLTPAIPSVTLSDPSSIGNTDLLVLPLCESTISNSSNLTPPALPSWVANQFPTIAAALDDLISDVSFTAKAGTSAVARLVGLNEGSPRLVAIFGIGPTGQAMSAELATKLGTLCATVAAEYKSVRSAALVAPDAGSLGEVPAVPLRAMVEGAMLGAYKDTRFKTGDESGSGRNGTTTPMPLDMRNGSAEVPGPELDTESRILTEVKLVFTDSTPVGDMTSSSLSEIAHVVSGVMLTRQLVNAPPNVMNPAELAQVADILSKAYPDRLHLSILEEETCRKLGMGSYLAVAQGSIQPPKFIHLTYKGDGEIKRRIAFVGKAITFDSGGVNLKTGPASMIELMKFDMGGSAVVLGTAKAMAQIGISGVEVHFIAAACENMCSGSAYRPGDVVTASNGTTIEVVNTDAEGRMTLADALIYAESLGVDTIIDIATLTGAAIISLGNDYAPFWTPSEPLATQIAKAAELAGENIWRMPLVASYRDALKSEIADLKHTGPRAGGSITAALFLKEFVKETPWAHWDIAGTCWSEKKGGATGYGVRTMIQLVRLLMAES